MLLSEVVEPLTFEITKLANGVDEDLLETMIEDHKLVLTFRGKVLLEVLNTLRDLIQRKIFDTRQPRVCRFDSENTRVLYAPREKALYIRYAFFVSKGMNLKPHPSWHDYKVIGNFRGKEQALGTTTAAAKDPDTVNLTRFTYPHKKKP